MLELFPYFTESLMRYFVVDQEAGKLFAPLVTKSHRFVASGAKKFFG